jgi:ATPase subunit of ABC transporter with duplicated ATPase domains
MLLGTRILFCDVNLNLLDKQRYGIVGANGAGKSTFLKLISGDEEFSEGEIVVAKSVTIASLKQDQFKYEDELILNVVLCGKEKLWHAVQEKEKILQTGDFSDKAGMKLAELEETIAHLNGYTAEATAAKLLVGLGIGDQYHLNTLSTLSGGYKLRVLLAKVLFENPDILLLDEPTNHLDIMTTIWLENYLKNEYKGVLVLVSHDVEFLNNVSTKILDIDYGEIREYSGNYTYHLEKKVEVIEQKKHALGGITKRIEKMQVFIDRFRSKSSKAKQVQSKIKLVDKIELPEIEKSSRISPNFYFACKVRSGKQVITVKNIGKNYAEKTVLDDINFKLNRHDKLAIIGHNGIGKSTLLKILMNKVAQDSGSYEWGHEVRISYFMQDHHDLINKSCTVLDWLENYRPADVNSSQVRKTLGMVLFTQDDVSKNVLSLSGGEMARLILAKIMLEGSNVLVLDEPTNHLDIESIDGLIKALQNYDGTLLFVSHDRYFTEKIANRVLAITEAGINDFHGNYNEFIKSCGADYLNQIFVKSVSRV